MHEDAGRRLRGCAIGCGVLLSIPVLLLLVVGVRTCAPLGSASRARSRLDERFGPPAAFAPRADGSIAPERLETFLTVRRKMAGPCDVFRDMQSKMERVEDLDRRGAPAGEDVVGTTRGFASVAVGIAPFIGEFFRDRDRALLDADMGLGEYTYIFALAYREQLLSDASRHELFFEGGLSPVVLQSLRGMLTRQLDALGREAPGAALRGELEHEVAALGEDERRLPWRDGLPEPVARSLEPFRERLDAAYCSATAGIAMDQGSGRALIIALY